MKHRVIGGMVVAVLICVCMALNREVRDPEDYTGIWYRCRDGMQYCFEEGLIQNHNAAGNMSEHDILSGAYSYGRNRIILFLEDEHGVGEVTELRLVRRWGGDILCEYAEQDEKIWFCRNQNYRNRG